MYMFSLVEDKSSDDKRNKNRNKEEVDEDYKIGWRSASGPKSDASIRQDKNFFALNIVVTTFLFV